MIAPGIFHGGFVANLEGGFRVPGIQTLAVDGEGVKNAVRVFPFLCEEGESPAVPGMCGRGFEVTGGEGQFAPPFGGELVVGRVEQAQFPSGAGILGHALRCGQVAAGVGLKHLYRIDGLADKGFQAFLFQLVGGESPVSAVHEQLQLQAAVQRMGGFVHLAVQQADEVHQALGQGDAHLLRSFLLGECQAMLRQVYLGLGEYGRYLIATHSILLQQLIRK